MAHLVAYPAGYPHPAGYPMGGGGPAGGPAVFYTTAGGPNSGYPPLIMHPVHGVPRELLLLLLLFLLLLL